MLAEPRRRDLLAAIGIDVYRLRPPRAGAADAGVPANDAAGATTLAIVCCRGARTGAARLAEQIVRALGAASARVSWHETDAAGALGAAPPAAAYLAFGAAAARALGEKLSTMQQMRTPIAIVEESAPQAAAAKRVLWHTLKPLARRLHESAG